MGMDIAGISTALSNASLQTEVGTAVLGKALDTNKTLGEGGIEMIDSAAMERSVNPAVGTNIDLYI